MKKDYLEICSYMPESLKTALLKVPDYVAETATELRLRIERDVVITGAFGSFKPNLFGIPIRPGRADIDIILQNISDNSLYTHEEDINSGFLTMSGGHRAGIAGTAYVKEGKVISVRNISSVSIRIASRVKGAASHILNVINNTKSSVLIAGPVSCGKTTILRDLSENLGDRVAVIDERKEIACVRNGAPRLIDKGVDILSGYDKINGFEIAIRAFSPEYIICDEISDREIDSVRRALFSGVRVIASAHAHSSSDLKHKGLLGFGVFETAVVLEGGKEKGRVKEIITLGGETNENSRNNICLYLDSGCGGV
jgi:stage III sporulation protein AA